MAFVNAQSTLEDEFNKNGEIYFKAEIQSSKILPDLTKIISIDNRLENTVWAYANETEFAKFLELGLVYKLLPHPNEEFDPPMATFEQIQNSDNWNYYPTYDAYVALMYQFETDYPNLCDVYSIGQSVNGREILVAKISDNVNTDENEPEFLYTSSMHGDELTGFPLMLNLIDSLLANYGSVTRMTHLINNIEIYINPLANPDGTYAGGNSSVSGATRYNANSYDLNRNFPDVISGQFPNTQTETFLFMAFAESRNFVMSANFHGGAEVVNYPWDHKYAFAADDDWWQLVSHEYADTCQANSPSNYLNGFNDGITNGAAWYVIDGGRQDYMNFYHQCREVTMEISNTKLIPASQLDAHWEYNRRSLLNYMQQCLYGIRGVVTDANTGNPIEAEIFIINHDIESDSSMVYSELPIGNYHRPIKAGTYDIRVSAPCYEDLIVNGISVIDYATTIQDFQLTLAENSTDFNANQTNVSIGTGVNFTDVSCGTPIIWSWTFEGAIPSTSTLQNPTNIIYNTSGSYFVKLVVSDGINSDSVTKQNYITVSEEFLMTDGSVFTCSGLFMDSGGADNNYTDDEDFVYTIYPSSPNAKIIVDFTMFDIESQSTCNYDWLQIYDGADISSNLIGQYCGTDSPGMILSTHPSGAITFEFHSDYSVTKPGWSANISCQVDRVSVDLTVFLEGPYNESLMNTNLTDLTIIPFQQPYNTSPWNYTGTESVSTIPTNVVDWILLELHDASSVENVNSGTMVETQAALLLSDGSIVQTDGVSFPEFEYALSQDVFIIIRHRNHLDILSENALTKTGENYVYDFSSGIDQVYGSTSGYKFIGSGIWGMVSGDANADGTIDGFDKSDNWDMETGLPGYLPSDLNMDGESNNLDKNDLWLINSVYSSQAPN